MIWVASFSSLGAGLLRAGRDAVDLLAGHDLVGEAHGRHGQRAVEGADGGEVLLVAHHHGADRHPLGLLHGRQRGGGRRGRRPRRRARASRCGRSRSDRRRQVDEVGDVDRARGGGPQGVELIGVDHDVLALAQLEALLDVVARSPSCPSWPTPSRTGCAPRLLLELMEVHVVVVDGAVGLDRHADQPEAQRSAPDGARHGRRYPARPLGQSLACKRRGHGEPDHHAHPRRRDRPPGTDRRPGRGGPEGVRASCPT